MKIIFNNLVSSPCHTLLTQNIEQCYYQILRSYFAFNIILSDEEDIASDMGLGRLGPGLLKHISHNINNCLVRITFFQFKLDLSYIQ